MMASKIERLFDLRGRAALVTGASKGIGRSIAVRLAQAGACITVTGRNMVELGETVAEIEADGGQVIAVRADVRSAADTAQAVRTAIDRFGSLDILVNNAGIYPPQPAMEVAEAQWDEVLDTNLKAAFVYAQAAARAMVVGGRGGKIVNISSMCAFHPDQNYAPYAVSKGGMITLTKSLAIEFASHKILVNAVTPGRIITPGVAAAKASVSVEGAEAEELKKRADSRILLGEFGKPDDVANAVLYLVSPASDYVTGSVIPVDGGYLLS